MLFCPWLVSLVDVHGIQEEEEEEGADEDPEMEGELTSADYRKLQSLVDEQEKAVEAGELITALPALQSTSHSVQRNAAERHAWYWVQERFCFLADVEPQQLDNDSLQQTVRA